MRDGAVHRDQVLGGLGGTVEFFQCCLMVPLCPHINHSNGKGHGWIHTVYKYEIYPYN